MAFRPDQIGIDWAEMSRCHSTGGRGSFQARKRAKRRSPAGFQAGRKCEPASHSRATAARAGSAPPDGEQGDYRKRQGPLPAILLHLPRRRGLQRGSPAGSPILKHSAKRAMGSDCAWRHVETKRHGFIFKRTFSAGCRGDSCVRDFSGERVSTTSGRGQRT